MDVRKGRFFLNRKIEGAVPLIKGGAALRAEGAEGASKLALRQDVTKASAPVVADTDTRSRNNEEVRRFIDG